jgi:uncharacterized membrane protein
MNEANQARNAAQPTTTLQKIQRWAPMVGGATLAVLGLSRRSKSGLAVAAAGGLVAYIATNTSANALIDQLVSSASVVVNASPEDLYRFWQDVENFPRFMKHIESVAQNGNRSHWAALGPMGSRIEWDAEITSQTDGKAISWRSLPESDIESEGTVTFHALPNGRGTMISAEVRYRPGGKHAGVQFAKLLGKDPSFLMKQDLRRLKALVETGEIPTTEGQTHGPRSAATAATRLLNPDEPFAPGQSLKDKFQEQRRAS